MMVAGIVGFPASGKGELSSVAREMGIPVIVMGDVIREAARAEGMEPADENLGRVAQELRQRMGMDAIATLCIPLIEQQHAPLILVDGIRGDAEVATFRRHFPTFILIGICSSFATRLNRLQKRGRSDDPTVESDLIRRDSRESGWGLERAIKGADRILINEGDLETFRAKARLLLGDLQRDTV